MDRASRSVRRSGRVAAAGALVVALLALAGWAAVRLASRGDEPRRPSILFVLVDALRADHVGAWGYARDTTPTIDDLAAQGTLFEHAVAPSNVTRTSMPSIWTGLLPSRHGVFDRADVLGPRFTTVAEILRESGYRTAAFCPNPSLDRRFGHDQGFEHYDDRILDESGGPPSATSLETASRINERFLGWLDAGDSPRRPFLAWLHYRDAHGPYVHPPFAGSGGGDPRPPRPITAEERAAQPEYLRLPDGGGDLGAYLDRYDGGIRHADDELGGLLRQLERRGLKDVVVVVTADHGESFLEHGTWGHGTSLFEEEIHVPLVVVRPGAGPWRGRRVADVVSTIDLFPTLLELAGCPPQPSDGFSLVPLLEGRAGYSREHAISEARSGHDAVARSLREGSWKLVSDWGSRSIALFDLAADPGETSNVFATRRDVGDLAWARLKALVARMGKPEEPRSETLPPDLEEKLESLGYVR